MATVTRELNWVSEPYKALVLFIPTPNLSGGALGAGWSSDGVSGRVLMPLPGSYTKSVLAHEFGHVFGLMHANALTCGSGAQDVATLPDGTFADKSCTIQTYGDRLDLMGLSQASQPSISSPAWDFGGFGTGKEIYDAGRATGIAGYNLSAWGGTENNRAVKFTDPVSGEPYYLELRLPVGKDSTTALGANRGVKIVQPDGAAGSVLLMPNSQPYAGLYNPRPHVWQAGQTFTTHAGTRVTIDSITEIGAHVTINAVPVPTGNFDGLAANVTPDKTSLRVTGWAVDRAETTKSTEAHVYITAPDGTRTGYAVLANGARPDVQAIYGLGTNHGFDQTFGISAPGSYNVCVFAIGNYSNPEIGCKTTEIAGAPSPVGFLDGVTLNKVTSPASLMVSGWTVDKGTPEASIPAHVYVTYPDGTTQGYPFTADQNRPDVNLFLGVTGNHGYSASIAVTKPGTYRVCAYGIAVTSMSYGNSLLGCTTKEVAGSAAPVGYLDGVAVTKSTTTANLSVSGWTVDKGTPTFSIPAHVYVTYPDGTTQGFPFTANQSRPDVNQFLGVTGSHGFTASVPITKPGDYRICAYGIAVTALSFGNSLLGCQSLQAPEVPSPTGFLEPPTLSQTLSGPSLNARGWTVDPGTPAASIPAHIYVTSPDGITRGYPFTADAPRPDVNQIVGVPGNHGFTAAIAIKQPGAYTVCAYGISVTPLSKGNSLLGCQSIQARTSPATVGYLDSVTVNPTNSGATLTATGWTADPGTASASIPVHTYVTGPDGIRTGYAFVADISRPDVGQALGIPGSHGYRTSIDVSQRGAYRVCTYGVAITPLSLGNSELGCMTLIY
ncbi:MAG: hypothetical protein NTU93_09760 [Arthrobacter sp.]|nr:hypothetical protein [Arthrobacter sp.]